jgi:hypothetical protein
MESHFRRRSTVLGNELFRVMQADNTSVSQLTMEAQIW